MIELSKHFDFASMDTARLYLVNLLKQIEESPFTVSRVCAEAGLNPSVVSRWKKSKIEPRLSSLERLGDAHERLMAEHNIARQALVQ